MSERFLEQCTEHNERMCEDAIRKARSAVPPAGTLGPAECDCGAEIPEGRRNLGYMNCVVCSERAGKR